MISAVMQFLLGVLVSALVVITVMPFVWRRALRLTRARIEADQPITDAQIRAQKDQLRAKHAVEIRRLEQQIERLRARAGARRFNGGEPDEDWDLDDAFGDEQAEDELGAADPEISSTLADDLSQLSSEELVERLVQRETRLAKTQQAYDKKSERVTALETRVQALEGDLAELQSSRSSDVVEIATLEGKLRRSEVEARGGSDRFRELKAANERQQATIDELQARLAEQSRSLLTARGKVNAPPIAVGDRDEPPAPSRTIGSRAAAGTDTLDAEPADGDLQRQLEEAREELAGQRQYQSEEYQQLRSQLDTLATQILNAEKAGGDGNLIDQLMRDAEALKTSAISEVSTETEDPDEEDEDPADPLESDEDEMDPSDAEAQSEEEDASDTFPRPPTRDDRFGD